MHNQISRKSRNFRPFQEKTGASKIIIYYMQVLLEHEKSIFIIQNIICKTGVPSIHQTLKNTFLCWEKTISSSHLKMMMGQRDSLQKSQGWSFLCLCSDRIFLNKSNGNNQCIPYPEFNGVSVSDKCTSAGTAI